MREMRRLNIWRGGQSLRDVDARIIIRTIEEPENELEETYGVNPGRSGQRLLDRQRIGKIIAVTFVIRELYDLALRNDIIDRVNAWAALEGPLTVSTRPGRQIDAPCRVFATSGNVREYTSEYRLEFRADNSPFWEDQAEARLTLSGQEATGELILGGSWPGRLRLSATPTSGTLTALTISATGADGKTAEITLAGLSAAAGDEIKIDYDGMGYLTITEGGAAALDKRTPESSDELLISPGVATIALTADAPVSAVIRGRGRWR